MMSVGRNDPCPCGSGKKYKRCCLANQGSTAVTHITSPTLDAEAFVAEVRQKRGERIFRRARGWEIQMSFGAPEFQKMFGCDVFYLTAMLYPARRPSRSDDWRALGEMLGPLGAPREPVLPWEDFAPMAPHHFAWSTETGERVEIPEFAKDAIRLLQRQRFGDPAAWQHGNGPCAHCGEPAVALVGCRFCDKTYAHCASHASQVKTTMSGHGLRVHPDKLPRKVIDALLRDEGGSLSEIRAEAAKDPEMWKKLTDFIAARSSR